ncbi:MAG: ATP-binding cassette domain-containing protein, partial [Clostridia bacterium]|nr:ATP-binding cassette domain-containing protein [Clostridia bacterium]
MENILLPVSLAGKNADADLKKRISFLMEALGIFQIENAFPKELSGGELRRMAIVRALCLTPDFIFADEPTGDLDDENTRTVLSLLKAEAGRGAAVMMVSHEQEAARCADRLFYMNAGELSLRQ